MKQMFFIAAIVFIFLAVSVVAVPNLDISVTNENSVLVKELEFPATYRLNITNNGKAELFEIYTLVGVEIKPSEKFKLEEGENIVDIEAYPSKHVRNNQKGLFTYEYQVKGVKSGIYKDTLKMKIVPLEEALEISAEPFSPEDSQVVLYVKNLENVSLGSIDFDFKSEFFDYSNSVSLNELEEEKIEIPITETLEGISAGPYIVSATIHSGDLEVEKEFYLDFLEKEGLLLRDEKSGFIVRKETLSKENVGNTKALAVIQTEKGFISRLFTSHSLEPENTERQGASVMYTWEKELLPGQTFEVQTTTNYTVPFILLVVIILVGAFVRFSSSKDITVRKNVSLVRTKGGEFALKVVLHVKARKSVENVELADSLPAMTKIYDKFGKKPDRIDEHSRRLFWSLGNLRKGEGRVYLYVIYSKLNVVGQFELPLAHASYTLDGKRESVYSNKAFFAAEKD